MKLHDLTLNKDEVIFNLVEKELSLFQKSVHPLKNNYKNLLDKIDNYLCFTVLTDKNHLVGFSGLYNNHQFPNNCARALNRLYYSKKYRINSLFPKNLKYGHAHSSHFMIPYQIEVAKKHNLDYIFVSVENYARRDKFFKVMLNVNKITGLHFKNLPHMYNVFPFENSSYGSIGRWQNISFLDLTGNSTFNFPSISISNWKDLHYKQNL